MRLPFALAFFIASVLATQKRYDGYQVYEVTAKNKVSFDVLVKLYNERSDIYDFWTEPRNVDFKTDVMVPPTYIQTFVNLLEVFGMEYNIKIYDVQKEIEESRRDIAPPLLTKKALSSGSPRYSLDWTSYSDLPAIYEFINELAATYPNMVTVTSAGQSYEGNDMPLVKISTGGSGKNVIFAEGGIHAREWIAPAYVTWMIRELVENYAAHPEYVDNIDWYIMPVLNPDGYTYTFSPSGDRLWRKNRAPNQGICVGTDLNRNFDFQWNTGGSSSLECGETYHGGAPFSQVEARNVRDAILSVANQTKVYFSFHSYGQYWLTPWGYTSALPDDYQDLYDLAQSAVDKLTAVEGTPYTIGTSTNLLGLASGCSDDWAKGGAGIKYSYTVEMRDTGRFGFQLPASQILPNNLEVWEGVKVVAEAVMLM